MNSVVLNPCRCVAFLAVIPGVAPSSGLRADATSSGLRVSGLRVRTDSCGLRTRAGALATGPAWRVAARGGFALRR